MMKSRQRPFLNASSGLNGNREHIREALYHEFYGQYDRQQSACRAWKNEYEKAMQLYDEAYEKGMDKPRLLRGYSVLLIRTGHFDKALEVLKK
ncbi:MAG: tetratricopeptide repeat protein [Christensenellales bacterium]